MATLYLPEKWAPKTKDVAKTPPTVKERLLQILRVNAAKVFVAGIADGRQLAPSNSKAESPLGVWVTFFPVYLGNVTPPTSPKSCNYTPKNINSTQEHILKFHNMWTLLLPLKL